MPLILCLLLTSFLFAQDENMQSALLVRQAAFADSLFSAGNYFDAVTEYERAIFFSSNAVISMNVLIKQGDAYRGGGKFFPAKSSYGRAYRFASGDSARRIIEMRLFNISLLSRDITSARMIIQQMNNNRANPLSAADEAYCEGWLAVFEGKWGNAAEYFKDCDSTGELSRLCRETDKGLYSVPTAKLLSAILPGAGAVYTGHQWNGCISLAWNLLFGYFTVSAFLADRIFDGMIVGELLWFRFYSGAVETAEKLAIEKNAEVTTRALHYLEYEYQGMKP